MKIGAQQRIHVVFEGNREEIHAIHDWIGRCLDKGIEVESRFQGPKMRDFPYTEPNTFIKIVDVIAGEEVQLPSLEALDKVIRDDNAQT